MPPAILLSVGRGILQVSIHFFSQLRLAQMNTPIPLWIIITSLLIAALAMFVGLSLYISPAAFIENTNFSDPNVRLLANMWAARQIAIGGIIGYSAIKKSARMLTIALAAYCLMNIQDVGIGVIGSDTGLMAGAGVFTLLSGTMIVFLTRNNREKEAS